ncbi:MAG: Gfo/Idh/MocA family oxidoreductase [Phycisphaerales bacterium]
MTEQYDRRDFLKAGTAGVAAWAAGGISFAAEVQPPAIETVRVGLVGVGSRGSWLLELLLGLKGVQVKAVCDIIEERITKAQDMVTAKGQPKPNGYSRSETDFERLCESEELDLVINAVRPWKWHVPISVAAMKAGKHTGTEVPAAETIEGCWQLVETAEKTKKHCVILENCCYFRNVMLVHNMLRQGLFGQLRHCEAGYQHYLPTPPGTPHLADPLVQTANSYPTHAIGPIAQWMDINRGDQFDYLVSMSADGTKGYPAADINTSLIRTVSGRTITLYYDTKLPRPYDLIYRVQGTQGIYSATLDQIYIEGKSPKECTWEPMDEYYKQYEHPLWKAFSAKAVVQGGHGNADLLTIRRLIQALQAGRAPDIDVYDAAAWSCITELSEKSVARRSKPMDFPDFTRGRWKTTPPIGIIGS